MNPTNIPPMIAWANTASPEELQQWLHTRLHGKDRRWPEPDDGLSVPHCAISEIVRHPAASDSACIPLVRAACNALREVLPAWAGQPEDTSDSHAVGGWTADAMVNLLLLVSDLIETPGPRREELRLLLAAAVPLLPCRAAGLPLRANGLTALIDLGGQPGLDFWMQQVSAEYPELTAIAFSGMARQNLEGALQWLGETQPLETQAEIVRKYRPTLVRGAGGETQFTVLVRRHLFRSNLKQAITFKTELAPLLHGTIKAYASEVSEFLGYDPIVLETIQDSETGQPAIIFLYIPAATGRLDALTAHKLRLLQQMFPPEQLAQLSQEAVAQIQSIIENDVLAY